MEDGTVYIDDRIVKDLNISAEYIEREKNIQLQEIERRSLIYRRKQLPLLKDRINDKTIIILVDDGAASGVSYSPPARSIRKAFTQEKLIIGLPVAPKETVDLLNKKQTT